MKLANRKESSSMGLYRNRREFQFEKTAAIDFLHGRKIEVLQPRAVTQENSNDSYHSTTHENGWRWCYNIQA